MNYLVEGLIALDVRLRNCHELLCSRKIKEHASRVCAHLQLRKECGLPCRLTPLSSHLDLSASRSEVEGLPANQSTSRTVPRASRRIRWEHFPGHTGNGRLRQQESEDVVCGCSIGLPEDVGVGQIGGLGDPNGSLRGPLLGLGCPDRGVVSACGFDHLFQRHGCGSVFLGCLGK
jgi:hypothetical protein